MIRGLPVPVMRGMVVLLMYVKERLTSNSILPSKAFQLSKRQEIEESGQHYHWNTTCLSQQGKLFHHTYQDPESATFSTCCGVCYLGLRAVGN